MSRVSRSKEYLKTGFTGEAAAAARFRAYAARAEREERPRLAEEWRKLAAAKDALAVKLLEAAGQVRDEGRALADALAEERYENDILYPKMMRDVDGAASEIFREVVGAQAEHAERLSRLRSAVQAAEGDIEPLGG
ncbi:MAG: hypothetical protein R3325_09230 [Thermoanaerobaculia bacterium]|nr:hypothetical protein [Thermoanaerobaculia bacterium]